MVEVSNLRDNACSRGVTGSTGKYPMWKLRNALFVTHVALRKYPSYRVVREFYRTVYHWRGWMRRDAKTSPTTAVEVRVPAVVLYRTELRAYGNQVIRVLQDQREVKDVQFRPPALPELPGLGSGPDDIGGAHN